MRTMEVSLLDLIRSGPAASHQGRQDDGHSHSVNNQRNYHDHLYLPVPDGQTLHWRRVAGIGVHDNCLRESS